MCPITWLDTDIVLIFNPFLTDVIVWTGNLVRICWVLYSVAIMHSFY